MKYHNILDDIVGEYFPAGYPDEECPTFLAIDEQIMKFGSLQHDTIDWESLILNCHRYLAEVCKDYKVLQYLSYALFYKEFKSNLIDFLSLFSGFNRKFFLMLILNHQQIIQLIDLKRKQFYLSLNV